MIKKVNFLNNDLLLVEIIDVNVNAKIDIKETILIYGMDEIKIKNGDSHVKQINIKREITNDNINFILKDEFNKFNAKSIKTVTVEYDSIKVFDGDITYIDYRILPINENEIKFIEEISIKLR